MKKELSESELEKIEHENELEELILESALDEFNNCEVFNSSKGDLKMTRREQKENKIEKRLEWAASREKKAGLAHVSSNEAVANIPLGQPILVGHHSEKRHRKALDRAHNNMSQSVEHLDMSKRHIERAEGIKHQLDNTIFSDDADVFERLQAKIEAIKSEIAGMKAQNEKAKIERSKLSKEEQESIVNMTRRFLGDKIPSKYRFFQSFEFTNLNAKRRQAEKRFGSLVKKRIGVDSLEKHYAAKGDPCPKKWIDVTLADIEAIEKGDK